MCVFIRAAQSKQFLNSLLLTVLTVLTLPHSRLFAKNGRLQFSNQQTVLFNLLKNYYKFGVSVCALLINTTQYNITAGPYLRGGLRVQPRRNYNKKFFFTV